MVSRPATRATLVGAGSRRDVEAAIRSGEIVRVSRGLYALPAIAEAPLAARRMSGVLSLTSAALHHGWEVLRPPDRPHVTVPRKRRVAPGHGVQLHRFDVLAEDIVDGCATGVDLTLMQCGRLLPFDEALAVFDSALRHGVPGATLKRVAKLAVGPGSPQVRRVAAAADGRAANAFESGLRSIALSVPNLSVRPQVRIGDARVDLADEDRQIVLEADSFAWHGDRVALRRDARRYDVLVAADWRVLRFAWEDVMSDQDFVRRVLVDTVAVVDRQADVG